MNSSIAKAKRTANFATHQFLDKIFFGANCLLRTRELKERE